MIFYINLFLLTSAGIYYIYSNELYIPIIDYLINTKIYVSNLIYGPPDNKFKLIKCELYTNLTTNYDVTKYFLYNVGDKIDNALIEKIYSNNNIEFINNWHVINILNNYREKMKKHLDFVYNIIHDKKAIIIQFGSFLMKK